MRLDISCSDWFAYKTSHLMRDSLSMCIFSRCCLILIKLSSRPNIFDAGGPSLLHDANLRLISKLKPASEKKKFRCLCLWSKSASQSLRALVKPLVCQRYDTSLHTIITELSIPISFVWMNFELLTNFRVKKKKSNWKKSRLPSIWLGWPLSLHFRFLIIRLERLAEKRQVAAPLGLHFLLVLHPLQVYESYHFSTTTVNSNPGDSFRS